MCRASVVTSVALAIRSRRDGGSFADGGTTRVAESTRVVSGSVALKVRLRELIYDVYEWRLRRQLTGARAPRHVGVILDGNRRWAREAGLDIAHGHRAGARKISELLGWCQEAKVEVVTLWLLSTDNLGRTSAELDALLEIISGVVDELTDPDSPWRVRIVGALDLLPTETAARLSAAALRTEGRSGMQVNVAVGYGGRQEITEAVRKLLLQHAEAGTSIEELAEFLNVDHISEHLYTSGQPDPDLLIRTSGEQRLSGFMLWQSAHSEFWFCEAYWPAFRRVDFLRALREYSARHRRYGG
ncbi:isoprenyl transferase [Saccharopolyspora sp. HNM0986]|nr:isoprenyl transferase [Saccharopolyspora sp. HNM0986]